MTDAELIARLRELDGWVMLGAHIHLAAADRIEALIAENERLGQQCEGLMQAGMNNGQALIIAEAKLAKAVEALEYYAVEAMARYFDDSLIARTALAEIKGAIHDRPTTES